MRKKCCCQGAPGASASLAGAAGPGARPVGVLEAKISSLGLRGDLEVRRLVRRALGDSEAAAQKFGWRLSSVCELPHDDEDVGYTAEDGTIYVKIRDPNAPVAARGTKSGQLYAYGFVLATLLHELVHLSHLGHGKAFYRCLSAALSACTAESYVRQEARAHVCAELLNAVCDNDARRARALLAVMPEAAVCRRPGVAVEKSQLPLEYAAHHGRVAITKLLLEARADPASCSGPSAGGGSSVGPLVRAAANGNPKTAALLLAARADVSEVTPKGQSVLDKAIAAAEAKSLLGNGGEWWNVRLREDRGEQPRPPVEDRGEQASPPAAAEAPRHRRRRRRRSTCSAEGSSPAPGSGASLRTMSTPTLPKVLSLPALATAIEARTWPQVGRSRRQDTFSIRIPLSNLAGSLAL